MVYTTVNKDYAIEVLKKMYIIDDKENQEVPTELKINDNEHGYYLETDTSRTYFKNFNIIYKKNLHIWRNKLINSVLKNIHVKKSILIKKMMVDYKTKPIFHWVNPKFYDMNKLKYFQLNKFIFFTLIGNKLFNLSKDVILLIYLFVNE